MDLWTTIGSDDDLENEYNNFTIVNNNINEELLIFLFYKKEIVIVNRVGPTKVEMDFDTYIHDILESFDYKLDNVVKQLYADLSRIVVYENRVKLDLQDEPSVERFVSGYLDKKEYIKLLLCTQANFGMLYDILYKEYSKDGLHLGMIMDRLLVSINGGCVLIKKKLRLFNLNNETISIINAKIFVNLELQTVIFKWAMHNDA